jgi:hypothetical protein
MRLIKPFILIQYFLFQSLNIFSQTTYYSKTSATNFNSTASWGVNTDGSGASPASITNTDNYIIQNNAALTLTANGSVRALTINGGSLTIAANTLTVAIASANNSTLLLAGGTLNVSGGTLNVNGNLLIQTGASFSQTGGNINLDGNSGTAATSVASGVSLFAVGTSAVPYGSGNLTFSGGTLTIVDPHAATAITGDVFYFNSIAGHVNSIGHTFRFGDGISATPGGNGFSSFRMNPTANASKFAFGNLIINGPFNAQRRVFNPYGVYGVLGDLTIMPGGRLDSDAICLNGNLTVNGDGTSNQANNGRLLTVGSIQLSNYESGTATASINPQTISGSGYFVNSNIIGTSTANFGTLIIMNSSAAGVTFADQNSIMSVIPGLYTNTATVSVNFGLGSGKINLGTKTFILGTSTAAPGLFIPFVGFTLGGFTSGTFKRWIGTSAITPTTGGSIEVGSFPFISANGESRLLQYGQTATITSGGTISVTFNDVAGQTDITPYTDNGVNIRTRSNSNWVVSTSGIVYGAGGSGMLKIRGDGYPTGYAANVRISAVNGAAAGTSASGSNTLSAPEGNKTAMSVADLAGTFYFASSLNTIQSLASGNWTNPTTWNCNCVPTFSDSVIINSSHTVTIDAAANASSLVINTSGALISSANTLTVANRINNAGSITISSAGTVTLGSSDNDNPFTNQSGGTLIVSGGTLNVNGNLLIQTGSHVSQTGGNINIDGNSGTLATSVAAGVNILAVGTSSTPYSSGNITFSGGTLTIVDPHAATTGVAFYFNSTVAHVNAIGHTFQFGNGVSATPGGNTNSSFQYQAAVNTRYFAFGNVIINGPYHANRIVRSNSTHGILGDLTIMAGGQFNHGDININGNITVNGDGTSNLANNGILINISPVSLYNYQSGFPTPSTNPQTISGLGYFVNNSTYSSSTSNFGMLRIKNTSSSGVTFANSNTLLSVIPGLYSNVSTAALSLVLESSKVNIGSNTFVLGSSAVSTGTLTATGSTTGFTGGTFKRWVNPSAISPTTGGNVAEGSFPFISANGESRLLQYGHTSTVTSGGTVSVTYNEVAGQTSITPYTDNGISIIKRSNSNWVVSTSGIVYGAGGSGILKIRGDGYATGNAANARISGVNGAAAGTSVAGSNTTVAPEGNKTAMTVANLSGTFYFALSGNTIQSVASGNWTNPATWNCNCVPSSSDSVVVSSSHTVTIDATSNAGSLLVNTGGTLLSSANTLTVANRINNAGSITISSAGTVTLGSSDNDNPFTNQSGGALIVSGGTLNVNGNLLIQSGSNVSQTGGNITIDGNSGTLATSVAAGVNLFAVGTSAVPYTSGNLTFSGGTLTIVDPHAATTGVAFYFNSTAAHINANGHTMKLGDGISATPGGNGTTAFQLVSGISSSKFAVGNLIVNGPYLATRSVNFTAVLAILGDLSIHAGGQFSNTGQLMVNGNITVDGDGTSILANNGRLVSTGPMFLAKYESNGMNYATQAQTISGLGYFVNNANIGLSTANFSYLGFQNTSAAGVTFSNANTLTSVIPGLYTNTSTVSGNLILSNGKLNIGNNTFTFGTSAASPGSFTYSQGGFRSGTFKRWIGTTAISPTTSGSVAEGSFPFISANGESRLLQYGQTSTVTSGGTVSVTYNDVAGQTSITPYTDNGISIIKRSNSNWVVSTSGIVYGTGGSGILKIRGDGYATGNAANARISGVNGAAAGTSVAGSNTTVAPEANKTTMTVANLTGTFYFALSGNTIQSVASGNWTNPATWNCNCVPSSSDSVVVSSSHTVTINATANAGSLLVNTGGTLLSSANTLTVANRINNAGSMTISSAGTVTLGSSDNDNPFTNQSGGSLLVSGGTLNINGNILIQSGASFSQTGGNINIDGNSGSIATSVAAGIDLFSVGTLASPHTSGTIAFSGGVLTIVDPHAATTGTAFYWNSSASHVDALGHTLRFGDGISATPGANATSAFQFSSDTPTGSHMLALGNVIINGPYDANRVVTPTGVTGILGDLTIHAGGQYHNYGSLIVNGNITVDGDGTSNLANNGKLITAGELKLAKLSFNNMTPSTQAQTISGSGYFVNNENISSSTANFTGLTISNSSPAGVTFSNLNTTASVIPGLYTNTASVSDAFFMVEGKVNIGTKTFTIGVSATSTGSVFYFAGGFTGGTMKRWIGTSAIAPVTGFNGTLTDGGFPFISANGESRMLQYGQTGTVSSGGTVSVTYNDVAGQTSMTPFIDNGINIDNRSNSKWIVSTGNGLSYGAGGSGLLKIRGDGYSVGTASNARLSSINGQAAGISGIGTNTSAAPEGNKTNLTVSQVNSTFYFAYPNCVPPQPVALFATPNCLSFDAVWSDNGAAGYILSVATDNQFTNLVPGYDSLVVVGDTSYHVNSNLIAGQTYYYRVKSFNNSSCISNPSASITVTIPTATQCNYCNIQSSCSALSPTITDVKLKSQDLNIYLFSNTNNGCSTLPQLFTLNNDGITSLATLFRSSATATINYLLELTPKLTSSTYVTVWYDMNLDAVFQNSEKIVLDQLITSTTSFSFSIPPSALLGKGVLRIISYGASNPNLTLANVSGTTSNCPSSVLGEVEDYELTVAPIPFPNNDNVISPFPLPSIPVTYASSAVSCSNATATNGIDNLGSFSLGEAFKDVWYQCSVPNTGVVFLNFQGVSYNDHDVQVWKSSNNQPNGVLTLLGYDDNSGIGSEPFIRIAESPGTILYLQVRSHTANAGGTFTIAATRGVNWKGTINSDWNTAGNWYNDMVPAANYDVVIPVTTNVPTISTPTTIHSIYGANASNVVLNQNLTFTGDLAMYGTVTSASHVRFRGPAELISAGVTNAIKNNIIVGNFTMQSGTLTIDAANGRLNVADVLNPNGGSIITNNRLFIRSYNSGIIGTSTYLGTGQIAPGTATFIGDVVIERKIPATTYTSQHYVSAPITSTTNTIHNNYNDDYTVKGSPYPFQYTGLYPAPQPTIWPTSWWYDASLTNYPVSYRWMNGRDKAMTPGMGVSINTPGNLVIDVQGAPQQSDVTYNVVNGQGNLIGNPFPSTLDLDKFIGDNTSNIGGSTVYYNKQGTTVSYSTLGGGISVPDVYGDHRERFMAHSNAFWVNATSNVILFNNTQRECRPELQITGALGGTFYAASQSDNPNNLRIRIQEENSSLFDEMLIAKEANTLDGIDNYDANKWMLTESTPQPYIYSMVDGQSLVINAMPNTEGKMIPLGLITTTAGACSLSLHHSDAFADETSSLELEDRFTGVFYNLKVTPKVSFHLPQGNIGSRFFLHIGNTMTSINTTNNRNDNKTIFLNRDKLFVNLQKSSTFPTSIEILNSSGSLITQRASSEIINEFDLSSYAEGVYFIRVNDGNSFNSHKVVYIKNH